jgi:hypothetical protein
MGSTQSLNRNEYHEYFLGDKGSQSVGRTTFRLHVPIFSKSGSLNVLVSPGPRTRSVQGLLYLFLLLALYAKIFITIQHILVAERH